MALVTALVIAPHAHADDGEGDFWEHAIDPAGAERTGILRDTKEIIDQVRAADERFADSPITSRGQRERARILADARAMTRYALAREPEHYLLLLRAGEVAELSARPREAIELYRRALAVNPSRMPEPHEALARLYARGGDLAAAIREYRTVIEGGNQGRVSSESTIGLAMVYMAARRTADAIVLLESADDAIRRMRGDPIEEFVLAVAYDRDGQVSKAHDVLEGILKQHPNGPMQSLQRRARDLTPHLQVATPLDQHYINALMFEVSGHLPEARAEWLLYAAGGPDAHYRARALAHAAAVGLLIQRGAPATTREAP